MKVVSVDVYDILGEQPAVALESRHFVRFRDADGDWIDVELRDGRVTVRGNHVLTISPHSGNQFSVEIAR